MRDHYFTLKCLIFLMRIVAFTLDNEEDVVIRNVYLVLSLVITTFFRFSFVARLKPCEMPYWFSMRLRLILENVVYLIWEIQFMGQQISQPLCYFNVLLLCCSRLYLLQYILQQKNSSVVADK